MEPRKLLESSVVSRNSKPVSKLGAFFIISSLVFFLKHGAAHPSCKPGKDDGPAAACDGGSNPGAFINKCGVCVGGSTGRAAGHGEDACGVCFGSGECVGCDGAAHSGRLLDACGRCLAGDSPERDGCVRITRIDPNVLDRGVDTTNVLSLRGANLNRTTLPDLKCAFIPADEVAKKSKELKIEMINVEDSVIQMEIIVLEQNGRYHLECMSSSVSNLTAGNLSLLLVNSKELSVSSLEPKSVQVDKSFQPTLSLSTSVKNSNVLCFIRVKDSENVHILQPVLVENNKVLCSNYTAKQAQVLEIGVVFTEDAATEREAQGGAGTVVVRAPQPIMKEARFSEDLQYIYISFDQNVDGPEACEKVLNPYTYRLLGNDPTCSFVANNLIIKLGANPTVQPHSPLFLAEKSHINRAFSDATLAASATGQVLLQDQPVEKVKPNYNVAAPKFICKEEFKMSANKSLTNFQPAFVRLVSFNGQRLRYSWVVNVGNMPDIPNRGQAENLRMWRSIRGFARELKRITEQLNSNQVAVNSSMFKPGIKYEFQVTGINTLGMRGDEKTFSMQLAENPEVIEVMLLGPDIVHVDIENYVEAKVFTCNSTLLTYDLVYIWSIQGDTQPDVTLQRGKRLRLQRGVLSGGKSYEVMCTVKISEESSENLGTGKMSLKTVKRGIVTVLATTEQTIGTGQELQLDASKSYDPDFEAGELQFQWCCYKINGGQCTIPEPGKPITLQSKLSTEFSQSILKIPPGLLSIGEYNFTVYTYKNYEGQSMAWTKIIVVPGTPPLLNVTPNTLLSLVDPAQGGTVEVEVMDVHAGCFMWWEVVQETGYQYFDLQGVVGLGDIMKVTEEEEILGPSREFPLTIPGSMNTWPGLKGDASYKLRLTASCPPKGEPSSTKYTEGHVDVVIQTNTPPLVKPLQVIPIQGEALRTQFEFSTLQAYDSFNDMPLQYNFGYRLEGEETNIFSSSNEDLKAYTILPAESGKETFITPVLQVCDSHKLCTMLEGQKVRTTSPNELSSEELQKILKMLETLLTTGQYAEALSLTHASLQTLEKMSDSDLYKTTVSSIEDILRRELKVRRERLSENPGIIQDSVDFLDMSISILRQLPMSDDILQDMFIFKDAVIKMISKTENSQRYRVKRGAYSPFILRKKRDMPTQKTQEIGLSDTNVENFLYLNEKQILRDNDSFVIKGIKSLIDELPTYILATCKNINVGAPKVFGNRVVVFRVEKFTDKNDFDTSSFYLYEEVSPKTLSTRGSVKLGGDILERQKPPLCLANSLFPQDYPQKLKTPQSVTFDPTKQTLVHSLWIMTSTKILKFESGNPSVHLILPLKHLQKKEGSITKCAVWKDGWMTSFCSNEDSSQQNSDKYFSCTCSAVGFYRIITEQITKISTSLPSTSSTTMPTTVPTSSTEAPTTVPTSSTEAPTIKLELPPSTTPMTSEIIPVTSELTSANPKEVTLKMGYNVSFRIDEDFQQTVGDDTEKFKKKIYDDLIREMPVLKEMIMEIVVLPGSIIVKLTLVDTKHKKVEEVIPYIKQVIGSGKLKLHGLTDQNLNVPPQDIKVEYPYTKESNKVIAYAVGGALGVAAFGILAVLITAVIYKKKKETERMRKLERSARSKIPTYRKFLFEESIDGTEASLARYRSSYPTTGTVSTLMGFGMLTGLGTQLNITPHRLRYEIHDSKYSQGSKPSKKDKSGKDEDADSGIMDSDVRQQKTLIKRKRKDKNSKLNESLVSLDNLPGTPTDDC